MNSSLKMDTEEKKSSLLNINPWLACLTSLVIYLLVVVAKHQFLISNDKLFSEFTGNDFEEYMSATNKFRMLKYFFLSLLFLGGILLTFLLISATNFLYKTDLSVKELFVIAVLSSSAEIISEAFTIFWFAASETFHSSEVFNFYPLSLFSLSNNIEDIAFPVSYILQSLNLFLAFKIFLICYAYYSSTEKSLGESFITALTTYVIPMSVFYLLLYYFF